MVGEPPPIPGQVVQLPPPAGPAAGCPGADVCQLVGLDDLHGDKNVTRIGVVTSNQTD